MIVANVPEIGDKVIGANGAEGEIIENNAPSNLGAIVRVKWDCAGRPSWHSKDRLTWDALQTAFVLDCA